MLKKLTYNRTPKMGEAGIAPRLKKTVKPIKNVIKTTRKAVSGWKTVRSKFPKGL